MAQFAPSETKTARASITVKPAGLICQAELYLGAKVATSGLKPFTSTGAEQSIIFPITMPSTQGAYPVYLDIFVAGQLIGAYQAIEDVTIVVAEIAAFTYSNVRGELVPCISAPAFLTPNYFCTIKNPTSSPLTRNLKWYWAPYWPEYDIRHGPYYMGWSQSLTLQPGQAIDFAVYGNISDQASYLTVSPTRAWAFVEWLEDDGNKSPEVVL